jgi:hypothetical protein
MTEDKKEPKIEEQESESESADNIAQQQELQKKEGTHQEIIMKGRCYRSIEAHNNN